ncbi:hypothetical protein K437DRAFT_246747 [Tilletiaria anomala UBC 951]|uniref:Translation machinery-associated protein 16 n=1 Tax=Tilletiaria anomala (strain ATCC 24038 / CBS 436.72 / UBC 951) TaxID=1037660 RepID=A0A066W5T2_TILAU|nr:uncharacterized protein K437DRAFT_246747 [Tilletiaria anomala UBC 951]KDN46150.1 hypothetical protein K437DRAFT_246747 [Tilletiaria anomala UBC 951]
MGGKKLTAKTIKRKNAPTHPNSRRAHQLARVAHREDKLARQKVLRRKVTDSRVERMFNMIGLLDPEVTHLPDLQDLHTFISDTYLSLNRERLAEVQAARRPGRPPSKDELLLQSICAKEKEQYKMGMEVPDLTNPTNVKLLRAWQGGSQDLPLFRIVRISDTFPDQCVLIQAGIHKELQLEEKAQQSANKELAAGNNAAPAIRSMSPGSPFQRADEFMGMH